MQNLAKAILNVMRAVTGFSKDMTVGEGKNAYKAVSYTQVSQKIREAMINEGLIIIPVEIRKTTTVERWEATEWDNYKKAEVVKMKQQVMTEAHVIYQLMHTDSGESMNVEGYGIGVDSQDKSAGKATTYALKYALIYTFLVPNGLEDVDGDKTPSDNYEVPKATPKKEAPKTATKPVQKKKIETTEQERKLMIWVNENPKERVQQALDNYELTDDQRKAIESLR